MERTADGEIGALRELNVELGRLSQTDQLTGKPNRAGFFAKAGRRLATVTARNGAALIGFADLDCFYY